MLNLPGYQILALIYESENSLVYRGRRERDNLPVILKRLKKDRPSPEEIARYEREYKITRSLNHREGTIKAYGLEKNANGLVMVLEDFGGESLRTLMDSQRFTLLGFLTIAIKIAESLGEIHASGAIHKDINPSNIAINPATGQLKIIDFSIANLLLNRENALSNNTDLEGTFAYISPEQTGRMNRSVDYRTDFYSLGVTFYELLANRLPFEVTDAMELIHCHIAKEPVPLKELNPDIPKPVSEITMKLLAKTAEERYQSAWGLKADLEECLSQLQHQGNISEFPLGSQDISEAFEITQKLYGREREIKTLLAAFDRVSQGAKEMMLVAGYSGIGKSALIGEIYKPVAEKGGYFVSGKFDQFQRSIPYSAVVSAFSELVRLLLSESEEQLNVWREKLLAAFGPNGQIIIDVIPEVELIVGPQPPVQELKPAESQNRFNLVFQNFIRVFCAPEHPLVIFLDDLQWADSASLKSIALMMTDDRTQYLFLIGAYRDNEVSPTHPLIMTVEALRQEEAIVNKYALAPLNLEQIAELISDTLHSNPRSVRPLAELVVRKTQGNPFFVNEFLKTLYQENLLTFNPPHAGSSKWGWQWDVAEIEAVGITENVVDLMIGKLKKLPESTQQVLRLGACLGNQFDLNTISLIHEQEAGETFKHLLPAIKEGLILPISEDEIELETLINFPLLVLNYKFLHDRVQQAAYTLIDDSQKKAVHLRIGRMLLASTPEEYRVERAFELVDHLNVGRDLIEDDTEKIELSALNLEAGKKAKDATAYVAAKDYLTAGIEGLTDNFWNNYYDLAFALHKERADVEYLNGNFEESEIFIQLTLKNAKKIIEKAEIYNLLLVQYALRAKYDEAVKAGREALALLGVELPEKAEELEKAIVSEFAAAKEKWGDRDIASLIDEPEMTIPEKKVAVKLLSNLATSAYLTSPQLWTVVFVKGVNISLEYGSTPESCLCYTNYGILLTSVFGDYKSAYQFGLLAMKLIDKWNARDLKCKACIGLANGINSWFEHIKESSPMNNEGYQSALESGDLEFAGYALHNLAVNGFIQGKNLEQILDEVPRYLQFTQKTKNQLSTDMLIGLRLALCNLTGVSREKFSFDTDQISEAEYVESCQSRQNLYGLCIYQIRKLQIIYMYGDLEAALACAESTEKLLPFITGTIPVADYTFYSCLVFAALYPEAIESEQKEYWQKLEAGWEKMKVWTSYCEDNFLHKCLLMEAEMARISGRDLEAIDLYDRAIQSATEYDFIQNEALANELAAKFWSARGKDNIANLYATEAYYGYQRWGAKRKILDLEELYPQLQGKKQTETHLPGKIPTATYTSSGGSGVLDLAAVMKATNAISSEIVLDKLLGTLMKISIENAGAQKGVLILPENGKLAIAAKASVDEDEVVLQASSSVALPEQSANESESKNNGSLASAPGRDLPLTVINYVERSRQDVVLGNAAKEGRFTTDPYIAKRQLKSVLCTPILNQGKLIGILYLENNLTAQAFTPDRLEVLRLISSQGAISLENALLYASLEQKVTERTQEIEEKNLSLEQTLHELQRTQAHLIQTEKMSGLGNLVAGVAHEINNPVSFIYGNIAPARDYVEELLNLIELYQEHYPDPVAEIEEEIEDMDLEFMVEDLQKLLGSMAAGAERIRDIVLSLRNFSRLDESGMKPVNLHEGIDSTIVLLEPRLREEGGRIEIQTIKKYGQLPKVTCNAAQLNQVFMNILSNAIDILEERRSQPKGTEKPTITISTATTDRNSVTIEIADNGPGMTEEVRQKIFNPFFTTKPVGSGTGLGLSISYQIVADSHNGELSCVSSPGQGASFTMELPIKPKN